MPPVSSLPANPNATADAKQLLAWMHTLAGRSANRLISGQHLGHAAQAESCSIATETYDLHLEGLTKRTGRTPALIGGDYGCGPLKTRRVTDFTALNRLLIDWWNRGGLVTLCCHAADPWTPEASSWLNDWHTQVRRPAQNLLDLVTPGNPAYDRWMADLARYGEALRQLRDAGMVVLWRPFHEMTGGWFWWGKDAFADNPEAFRTLWRHMFGYFTDDLGLDNLLWSYTPANSKDCPPDICYPGSDVVDIVGLDAYVNDVTLFQWERLEALGKPLFLGEFGPAHNFDHDDKPTEAYDYRVFLDAVKTRYPTLIGWMSWLSSLDDSDNRLRLSLMDCRGTEEVLNDPLVVTLETLDWRNPVER